MTREEWLEEWVETDELTILRNKIERLGKRGYWNADNLDAPPFDLSKIEPLGSYDVVRHGTLTPICVGSIPTAPVNNNQKEDKHEKKSIIRNIKRRR